MSDRSKESSDPKVKFLSIALALVLALFWGFLIAGTWYYFNIRENTFGGTIINWFARLHVLLVHLPIGLIFLVVMLEIFGRMAGFADLQQAVTFTLWFTLVGAIGATVLGFLLMEVEEGAGKAMTLHMWTGLGVVVLTLFALIFKIKGAGAPYGVTLLLSVLCISAAGHYGGAMVHEADYLSEFAPDQLKPVLLAGLADPKKQKQEPVAIAANGEDSESGEPEEVSIQDRLVYDEFIIPLLDKTCNECHNENKIKGKLRMDTHELLLAGAEGSDFPTVVPGDAEASEMIVRVMLEQDDDEFMPPKGEPFTKPEIDLLKLWIQAGAKTDAKVADLGSDPSIATTIAAVESILAGEEVEIPETALAAAPVSIWDTLAPEEQSSRLKKVQEEADRLNISIMPISIEDDRLRINVLNGASDFGDEQIAVLEPVAERVMQLNLAKSKITDEAMKVVGKMSQLEKLHLENTQVTDAGVEELVPLKNLNYLNLYSTGVTDKLFASLAQMPNLRKVYVWQTEVSTAEARRYEESVNLEVNTGIDLEKAALEAKQKAEAEEKAKADEAAKKKAEADAAAKKKAAADAAAKKKADEEAARKKAIADAAAKKKAEAEAARKKAEEAAAKAKAEADANKTPQPEPQQQ